MTVVTGCSQVVDGQAKIGVPAPGSPIDWAQCESGETGDAQLPSGAECGMLSVPVDYDKPDGELLHLTNWVECIRDRSKKVACPVEAGVSAAGAAHLANQSFRTSQIATWKG